MTWIWKTRLKNYTRGDKTAISNYIDYDQVGEDAKNLHEHITDELEVKDFREVMLLLDYTKKIIKPEKKPQETEKPEELDYVG